MKSSIKLLTLSALTLAASHSFAAERATLTITGSVGLPACDVTLKQPQLDFGRVGREQLSGTAAYSLAAQTVEADVVCGGISEIALSIIDNKATQARPDVSLPFNVGGAAPANMTREMFFTLTNVDSRPIGAYVITARSVTVDNMPNLPVVTWKPGSAFSPAGRDLVVAPGNLVAAGSVGFAATPSEPEVPVGVQKGTNFGFLLSVAPTLLDTTQLPVGKAFKIEGSAALEVKYL